ncbi:hypothetical protein DSM25558_2817 [Agrobacterium sp. DSM 25558]|uniref:Uncharacterized protein n=2 Tax=Agrobacterium TaxID=357 RepID=A0A1R3TX83_9HYPH|nr:hypothetical protein DSM25558_2817 [Agrobacterium sp. DSM 25558]SCX31375.1 hypothetical protein DSM25559_3695 [Agrobacterium rosae]
MAELHNARSIYRAAMKISALKIKKGKILLWLLPVVLPMLVVGAPYLPFRNSGRSRSDYCFLEKRQLGISMKNLPWSAPRMLQRMPQARRKRTIKR